MTDLFLVVLVAGWLVAIIPALLRAKRHTPLFTAENWRRRMRALAPPRVASQGRWIVAPASSGAVDRGARRVLKKRVQRRKRLLAALIGLVFLSLVAALIGGGRLWDIHFASYAVVAVYVALLVEERRARTETLRKVHTLAGARRTSPAPEGYAERRA